MQKSLNKNQSILVLFFISIFGLSILFFSIKVMNNAKDLTLQADMERINSSIMEYIILNHDIPEEKACNLKERCLNLKKEIKIFTDKNIYYTSNKKNYILYSSSFSNKNIYFLIDKDFLIKKVLNIPEL